jgi:hypothetical protein
MEDRAGRAKPKTERIALGMCRMWMLLAQIIYGKYLCEEDAVVVVVVRQEREIGWEGLRPPRVHTLVEPSKVRPRRFNERVVIPTLISRLRS